MDMILELMMNFVIKLNYRVRLGGVRSLVGNQVDDLVYVDMYRGMSDLIWSRVNDSVWRQVREQMIEVWKDLDV